MTTTNDSRSMGLVVLLGWIARLYFDLPRNWFGGVVQWLFRSGSARIHFLFCLWFSGRRAAFAWAYAT